MSEVESVASGESDVSRADTIVALGTELDHARATAAESERLLRTVMRERDTLAETVAQTRSSSQTGARAQSPPGLRGPTFASSALHLGAASQQLFLPAVSASLPITQAPRAHLGPPGTAPPPLSLRPPVSVAPVTHSRAAAPSPAQARVLEAEQAEAAMSQALAQARAHTLAVTAAAALQQQRAQAADSAATRLLAQARA